MGCSDASGSRADSRLNKCARCVSPASHLFINSRLVLRHDSASVCTARQQGSLIGGLALSGRCRYRIRRIHSILDQVYSRSRSLQTESQTHFRPSVLANAHPRSHSDTNTKADSESHTNANASPIADRDSRSDCDAGPDAFTNSHASINANPGANTNPGADVHAQSNGDAQANTNAHTQADTECDPYAVNQDPRD